MVVRTPEDGDPMHALNRGYSDHRAGGARLWYWLLLAPVDCTSPDAWWHFWLCGVIGLLAAVAFVFITQYYTE